MKTRKHRRTFFLDGESLTINALEEIALRKRPVGINAATKARIARARQLVEQWVHKNEKVYGVTTGFGEFSSVRISPEDIEQLQENLILSHSAGTGEPLPREIVRAMMALRINALAKGHSGIRNETVDLLAAMLNHDIVPVIPSQGSVGSSGDLVQLSHLVLAMIGKGAVWNEKGTARQAASAALRRHRLKPAKLTAKEGLALINGTQMMTAYAGLAVKQARDLACIADISGAMSLEALRGSDTPFDERIHKLRPYNGQLTVASNIRRMMKGSEIRESHRFNDPRVQDAYSLRCIPQVHGASRDAIDYVMNTVSIEMNSANDNPLIFPKEGIHLEGGNFHGQPIALAMDFLAIALSELANISERRIERLVNGSLSGLPKFLTRQGGLNSGLMIAQYTAASLVSENKVLSHPGSVDSIPTSANQEDHNSMGSISAQKAWRVLKNAQAVIGIELLCAAQGLDFTKKLEGPQSMDAGRGVEGAYRHIRSHIRHLERDRLLYPDIQTAIHLVKSNSILEAVERIVGSLSEQ
jgi:histidine ammonia-lyase